MNDTGDSTPYGNHIDAYHLVFLIQHEDLLEAPLSWGRPRLVFVNSMSDLFHEEVPFAFIQRVFDTMRKHHNMCCKFLPGGVHASWKSLKICRGRRISGW